MNMLGRDHHPLAASSRTEGELVVAVAAAPRGLGTVVRKPVRVGAGGARAHETSTGAAGEGHRQVVAVNHGDVIEILGAADAELGQRRGWLLLPPLKEQPVRPQNLPVVPAGTSAVHVCPGSSCVPPPTGKAAGHTVDLQLLLTVKVAALAPAAKVVRRRKRIEETEVDAMVCGSF